MTSTINRIDFAMLEGKRPRPAGSNARLGHHGDTVRMPTVRIRTSDGVSGFGRANVTVDEIRSLLGKPVADLVPDGAVADEWRRVEFPLLDLAGQIAGAPVSRLAGSTGTNVRVRAYDTSLYFDDLHLDDDREAAELIAAEAMEGVMRGHTAFKIKVGRGARHMDLEAGTLRDISIIRTVRETVGPDALVMIDANNGWNLNITKRVLAETADANLYWLEEAFHEDNVLYRDLREWLEHEGLGVRIADGEGAAHPSLVSWAKDGTIDVVQYDMVAYGYGNWHRLARDLDAEGVATAPHTYGNGFGHIATCHLAGDVQNLEPVEWDEATFDEIDASAWQVVEGWVDLPDLPGFGLSLDEERFDAAVRETGFTVATPSAGGRAHARVATP